MKKVFLLFVFAVGAWFALSSHGLAGIKVGCVLPMTGGIAFVGEAMHQGVQIALDEAKSSGGIKGEEVIIHVEDSKSDPKEANSAVAKLLEVDKIRILLGPARSGSVLATKPLVEKAKAVMMAPVSTHPDVPDASKGVFRTCPSDADQGIVGAKLAKELGLKKMATLFENSDYGKGLSDAFTKAAEGLGLTVSTATKFNPQDQDFRTQLTKIKGSKVDGLYIVSTSETPDILKQANLLKLNVVIIGVEGSKDPKNLERGGKDMEGMWVTAPPFWEDSPDATTQKFISAFKKKFAGEKPRFFAAQGYDGMIALIEAMRRKGSDPMQIREGLLTLKDFPGATGSISMMPNGGVIKPFAIFRVENNGYAFKKFMK